MKRYIDTDRTLSLGRLVPDLFKHKTVLNIGARTNRFDYGQQFREAGYNITILEPFAQNVEYLRTLSWIQEVVQGDVRDLKHFKNKGQKFDVVFWWHGPEHVIEDDLRGVLPELDKICNNLIVLGCPWGHYPQGHIHNNPWEEHVGHYSHHVFEEFGYDVECLGIQNVAGSNITSVKRMPLQK
jgi:SAM-dependent methyltransferase